MKNDTNVYKNRTLLQIDRILAISSSQRPQKSTHDLEKKGEWAGPADQQK